MEQLLLFVATYGRVAVRVYLRDIASHPERFDDTGYLLSMLSRLATQDSIRLARALIDVGYFLPRLEMFRSVLNTSISTSDDIVVVGDAPLSPRLPFVHKNWIFLYPWDIVFGPSHAIVYADLRNISVLRSVIDLIDGNTPFALRPISNRPKAKTRLRGWGAE
jgi:hypothetical protein